MPDLGPQDVAAERTSPPADSHPPVHLPVLPNSGKVEDLRRQADADRGGSPAGGPSPVPVTTADDGAAPTAPLSAPAKSIRQKLLEGKVIEAVRQVYDPEIPVNVYDLGLIYEIDAGEDGRVKVKMTLTAPACPVAGTLPGEVEKRIENIPEVVSADVELVWDPPWTRDRMSEAAQLELGLF